MDDSEIIARVLAGQQDAFGALVERYQRQLYYFVVGKVAEDTEAKDIVQKSFVSAYQNLRSFQTDGSLFAWLKGIALKHCRNEWRRYHSQSTLRERLLEARRAELELAWLEERHHEGDRRVSALHVSGLVGIRVAAPSHRALASAPRPGKSRAAR